MATRRSSSQLIAKISLTCWAAPLALILVLAVPPSQGQYDNTRCKCICPDPQVVNGTTPGANTTISGSPNRTLYISNTVGPTRCTCVEVVLPVIEKKVNIKGKEGEFCPRCECVYESRNLAIIKVVVIIVIWVVSLLMIYMLFLMCLDPLLNKRIKNTAYQEHTNEDDDSVGGSRTSHPMRVTGGSALPTTTTVATSLGPSSSVLNRVGHQQSKWKRQVQEQRKNIYDRHTMLN